MTDTGDSAKDRRTIAPLIAAAIALLAVIGVVVLNWVKPAQQLTVADLRSPVVAGLNAGDAVYPPNSTFGVGELAKFGYLPELPVARTADGDLVAGTDQLARDSMGLDTPIAQTGTQEFLDANIKPPRSESEPGEPVSIENALEEYGKATVFIFTVTTAEDARQVLDLVKRYSKVESVIIRTADAQVAKVARGSGAEVLVQIDDQRAAQEPDATMVELPVSAVTGDAGSAGSSGSAGSAAESVASVIKPYTDQGLKVWVNGVQTEQQLTELSQAGVYGALATNPFTIQPSAVKTD